MFDIVHEPVPAGLDQMTPGPTLGALLASICGLVGSGFSLSGELAASKQ